MNFNKLKFNIGKKEVVKEDTESEPEEYWVCCEPPDMITSDLPCNKKNPLHRQLCQRCAVHQKCDDCQVFEKAQLQREGNAPRNQTASSLAPLQAEPTTSESNQTRLERHVSWKRLPNAGSDHHDRGYNERSRDLRPGAGSTPRNPETTKSAPSSPDSRSSGLERHVSWKQAPSFQNHPDETRHTGVGVRDSQSESVTSRAHIPQSRTPESRQQTLRRQISEKQTPKAEHRRHGRRHTSAAITSKFHEEL